MSQYVSVQALHFKIFSPLTDISSHADLKIQLVQENHFYECPTPGSALAQGLPHPIHVGGVEGGGTGRLWISRGGVINVFGAKDYFSNRTAAKKKSMQCLCTVKLLKVTYSRFMLTEKWV